MLMTGKSFRKMLSTYAIVLGLAGCAEQLQDPRTQVALVRTVPVLQAIEADGTFTGVVTARVQSDLSFRVAGKVTNRFVDVGQSVRAGQPLLRIDITDFTNAIASRNQDVSAARAKAEEATADELRYRGLVSTGAVSASVYDQVKASADSTKAQLAAAEAQANIAKDEGSYTLLVAEADGVVIQTLAEPGQVVASGQTVIKLAHAGPREASISLPETLRPPLGSVARASLFGSQSPDVTAKLRQLADASDLQTRTFEARYVLQGSAAGAPLGATVTVYLHNYLASANVRVPISAITDRGNGPGVWVLNQTGFTVSFRPVKIASLGNEEATLSGGVKNGEIIVALGAHLLSEGESVRVENGQVASR